ncbi:hypothetical protein K3G63_15260 [Hymenobacter sp. HSC-4F20]|uniref:hypothetical protein n=1 Tax=Hymenobacter sp. HSC-4F20 TaxID=2864135 RepID=UPI001C72D023|nr:hypothetical protein [Hymenobacter sp. HSC-4F20]MBX0291809.1 hypothetical protein [Hymenobacter sp. HSC-4F20]
MKPLFKILLGVLTLLVVSGIGGYFYMKQKFMPAPSQLAVASLPATCRFTWLADSTTKPTTPHAALLLPVRLPGCPRTCYFQFDTGAPTSLMYGKALAALRGSYPGLAQALPAQADTLRNFQFGLGTGQVTARSIRVLDYGRAMLPADTTQPFIIGTLGTDVLEGRVLVLDYAQQRFTLEATVPDNLSRQAAFVPLQFTGRRVLLNATVQDEPRQLLFDSGSSAFSLLTSQDTWQTMIQPSATVQHAAVNSMGRTLHAYTAPTPTAMQLGSVAVPFRTVTYIEGTSLKESLLMRFSGMGGMLGNEPFAQRTIILDTKGGRFGLVM